MTAADRKLREAAYFREIGDAGVLHAATKPWTDPDCAQYLQELGSVLALFPPPPGRLLDIGCGAGWTSALFAQRGYQVDGIDLSPEAIAFAGRFHDQPGLHFEVQDFDDPVRNPASYDIAVFFDSLHHSVDEIHPLRLAFEALRPGGVCIVCEPGKGHADAETSREAVAGHGVTERDMTPPMVAAAARKVGFGDVEVFPHPQRFIVPVYRSRNANGSTRQRLLRRPSIAALRAWYAASLERRHWGLVKLTK
ncbi:MAG: class I SAM-dependent methyltransferase [Acidimicrobiales bacterium]